MLTKIFRKNKKHKKYRKTHVKNDNYSLKSENKYYFYLDIWIPGNSNVSEKEKVDHEAKKKVDSIDSLFLNITTYADTINQKKKDEIKIL